MFKIYTALITPFHLDNSIDYNSLDKLIQSLIDIGNTNFVLCGTTGEACCLTMGERVELVSYILHKYTNCHFIVGISTNCTKEAVRQIEIFSKFEELETFMIVVPYYNKPSQDGLHHHFDTIAKSTSRNIILYNIPGRSMVSLNTSTILKLITANKNIIGLKQAGDINETNLIKEEFPDFLVYLGSDELLQEAMELGLDGVISVSSHLFYECIKDLVEGKSEEFDEYITKSKMLFMESSPAPLKYLLSKKKIIHNFLRLPLVPVSKETQSILDNYFSN